MKHQQITVTYKLPPPFLKYFDGSVLFDHEGNVIAIYPNITTHDRKIF